MMKGDRVSCKHGTGEETQGQNITQITILMRFVTLTVNLKDPMYQLF